MSTTEKIIKLNTKSVKETVKDYYKLSNISVILFLMSISITIY